MGEMTLGGFIERGDRSRGPKRSYLKDPRKWKDGQVTVWLSCQASIHSFWRHNFQKIELVDDKQSGEKRREVWKNQLVCYEVEEVLENQYFRDRETRLVRELPPQVCPHCLMVEDVFQRVKSGELDWREPLFRFTGSDPNKTMQFGKSVVNVGDVWIHAGGLCNLFGDKKLSEEKKKELAKIPKERGGPVYQNSSFRQNNWAKCEYIFTVAEEGNAQAGLQVAIMPKLLGEKMQSELKKRAESKGPKAGNPVLSPVAFRWSKNADEGASFDKSYDAFAVEMVQMTPAIEKLIRGTPPPDVKGLQAKFNWKTHKALLERHIVKKDLLPIDSYFAEVAKRFPNAGRVEESQAEERNSSSAPEVGRPAPQQPAAPAAEEDVFGCDKCGAEMKASETTCAACGTSYEVQADPPPPPPKPALRKRSEARAQAAGPADPPADLGSHAEENAGGGDEAGGYPGDPSDDIPF